MLPKCVQALGSARPSSQVSQQVRLVTENSSRSSVGGSDAHYVSSIGRFLTSFERPIRSIEALVEELKHGNYFPLSIDATQDDFTDGDG